MRSRPETTFNQIYKKKERVKLINFEKKLKN